MTVTARQYIALHLYYCEGWSYRRIGKELGLTSPASTFSLVARGRKALISAASEQGANTLPSMRALFAPGPTSDVTNVGLAASRRDELLDALELRMEQRAKDLAAIEECMSSGAFHPTRTKRCNYTLWERRYLMVHAGEPLPTTAYSEGARSPGPAWYCASDWRTCGLECVGCDRNR